jgi:parallel beta-helix repeat protein
MKIRLLRASAPAICLTIVSGLFFTPTASAQQGGPLTPPPSAFNAANQPQPTLAIVDPRTPISTAPYTISSPGSYYLTTNLTVAGGDAIDINASGVTLDLNGFTISSTASSASGNAIHLASASANSDITIVNGHIVSGVPSASGFDHGITANGTPSNILVSGVSVSGCGFDGINVGDQSIVKDCTVSSNYLGIIVGNNSIVSGCNASGNTSAGIYVYDNCTVTGCTASGGTSDGIVVGNNSTVSGCTASGNGGFGIFLNSSNCTVSGCNASGNIFNGIYLYLLSPNCTVTGCTASGNTVEGIIVYGYGCTVSGCTASGNTHNGIHVYGKNCTISGCTASGNTQNGIFFDGDLGGANCTVKDCTANGNTGAGIAVNSNGNVIIKNVASSNGSNYSITGSGDVGPTTTAAAATSPVGNISD